MPTWGHNGKDGVYEVHWVYGSSAVPRVSLAYSYMYRDWDFKRKYWRAHRQRDRQMLWLYLAAFRCQTITQELQNN